MSLEITVYKVRAVLLADGWYAVLDRSFTIDTYEYVDAERRDAVGLGQQPPDVLGYAFKTGSGNRCAYWVNGPLAAIQAVELDP